MGHIICKDCIHIPVCNLMDGRTLCGHYTKASKSVNFPVLPNDTVYTISRGKIKEWIVYYVGMNSQGDTKFTLADEGFHNSLEMWDFNIGVCVFLTEEDAINELKERKSYECT